MWDIVAYDAGVTLPDILYCNPPGKRPVEEEAMRLVYVKDEDLMLLRQYRYLQSHRPQRFLGHLSLLIWHRAGLGSIRLMGVHLLGSSPA